MAQLVLVIAKSGTGKSSSMRNLTPDEAAVVLCSGKDLPFRHNLKTLAPSGYGDVLKIINQSSKPMIIIDDANYLMSFEEMDRAKETGYGKFTDMAANLFSVFKAILDKKSDQVFYIMAHQAEPEEKGDDQLKFKTTGKMLSEKVVLEGLSNIIITTEMINGDFVFRVKTDGKGVKTPLGMFDTETIENDLKLVDQAIRKFYDMKPEPVSKKTTKKEATNASESSSSAKAA